MTERKLDKAVREQVNQTQVLDETTRGVLENIRDKDRKLRIWATIFFFILFFLGVLGIFYQNRLATHNKNHIDCIVKLLATPTESGQTRSITDLSTCQIKVSE